MGALSMQGQEFSEVGSRFPLTPIEDDSSYHAALKILDRLFALDDRQTRAESEYFRALAEIAFEYEMKRNRVRSVR
jgi:hypothetical protein